MEKAQQIFERFEKKYLISQEQYLVLKDYLLTIAHPDEYGETAILSLYYDTPNFHLIRNSLDGPVYKEKLRLRSYGIPQDDSPAFIELKKKYEGIVYKRRTGMPYRDAISYLSNESAPHPSDTQIRREISWFCRMYTGIAPAMVISCDRTAWVGNADSAFRVTFDRNIRWRRDHLDLKYGTQGNDILNLHERLVEIKINQAMHLKMASVLNEIHAFPVSFSKYGLGYTAMVKGERKPQKAYFPAEASSGYTASTAACCI